MILGKSLAKPLGVSLGKSFAGDEGGSYVVTFSCTHGSVGATVDGIGIQSGDKVKKGKYVVFTITPDPGWRYEGTNPETVQVTGPISRTFTCSQVFHTVTFSAVNGSVTANVGGSPITSPAQVAEGASVVFNAVPSEHFVFLEWGDHNTDNPRTEVVSSDITLEARCRSEYLGLTFTFPGGSGSVLQHLSTGAGGLGDALWVSEDGVSWSDFYPGRGMSGGFTTAHVRGKCGSNPITGLCGTYTKVSGNVMSLVDYENVGTVSLSANQFYNSSYYRGLFQAYGEYYNTLVDASELVLPATTLTTRCYSNMFRDCVSLTSIPSIPADTLGQHCYNGMFLGCTSLTSVPSLPATTLANYCYAGMFRECTSLVTPPSLPATNLAQQCYENMFYDCTSLVTAPDLPATTLARWCYGGMFTGCTHLEGPVNISATSPYYAGTTSTSCQYMFSNSGTQRVGTNKSIIIGEGGNVSEWNLDSCGINSTYWTVSLPPNYLKYVSDGDAYFIAYTGSFMGIEESVPNLSNNFEYSVNGGAWTTGVVGTQVNFNGTVRFRGLNLSGWGPSSGGYCRISAFSDRGAHVVVSGDILTLLNNGTSATISSHSICGLFSMSSAITDASGLILPTGVSCSLRMLFDNCTSLTGAPSLEGVLTGQYSFREMFNGCTSLVTPPALPATSLNYGCYRDMFHGCTSLTSAPALPATTLPDQCYRQMFYGCTHLAGPVNISATSPYYSGTTSTACYQMFTSTGTQRATGADNRIIIGEGGDTSLWNSSNCGIDSTYWTVQAPVTWTGLKFTSDSTNTVCISTGVWLSEELHSETPANVTHNCEYSADGINWTTIPEEGSTAAPTFSGTVYVRGNNPEGWDNDSTIARITFGGSGHVTLSGNILSLIDNGTGTATTVPSGTCFTSLFGTGYPGSGKTVFSNNNAIVDASGLVLNNGDVSQVYPAMFRGCTYLVNPPALPATTLGRYSYQYMFADCSHLVSAPVLPALTLTQSCYGAMFQNCTSLTGPVNISATSPYYSGTSSACIGMFTNSGSAGGGTIYVGGNVSDWNSTNCGINSTYWTVQAPWTGLKFTSDSTNTVYLYEGTWLCEDDSVASNPNISHNCQYSLDNGTTWNTMPTDSGSAVSFTTMQVRGNNSSGWGDGSNAPSFRFNGDGHVSLSGNLFSLLDNGTGTITSIPSGSRFPATFGNVLSWSLEYTKVTDASGLIIPDASATNSYALFFQGCSDLVTPPSVLPSTITNGSFNQMFRNCTSLTSAPSLPATTLAPNCYQFMFQGCTSLVTPPSLPAPTLKSYCYTSMFNSCTKLTGPVNISATSPYSSGTTSACSNMFTNSGTASGAGGTIYVGGGTVSEWQSSASIDTNYWTVEVPTEEDE